MTPLAGWVYRKKCTLTGSSAGAQTDYQVLLKVYFGSGTDNQTESSIIKTVYANSHCKSDFEDLRFALADGALLDYYVIEQVNGSYALVAVEVDSVPASPAIKEFYLYYGNPSASTLSSVGAVGFFDPFNNLDAFTNKTCWTVNNGEAQHVSGAQNMYSASYSSQSVCVFSKMRLSLTSQQNAIVGVSVRNSVDNYYGLGWDIYYDRIINVKEVSNSLLDIGLLIPSYPRDTATHHLSLSIHGSNLKASFDSASANISDSSISAAGGVGLFKFYGGTGSNARFDWLVAVKYVYPEPSITSWGSEEIPVVEVAVTFSVNVLLSELIGRQALLPRTLTNNTILSAGLTKQFKTSRIFDANLTLTSRVSSALVLMRKFTAYLSLSDGFAAKILLYARQLTAKLSVEGTFSRFFTGKRGFIASSVLMSGFNRILSLVRSFPVSVGLTAIVERGLSAARRFGVVVGLSSSVFGVVYRHVLRLFMVGKRHSLQLGDELKEPSVTGKTKAVTLEGSRGNCSVSEEEKD